MVIYLVRVLGCRSGQVGEGPVLSGVGLPFFVMGLVLAGVGPAVHRPELGDADVAEG